MPVRGHGTDDTIFRIPLIAALIVVVTLAVMTTGRAPAVLALATALVVAGLVGIASPAELFAGLSNGGVGWVMLTFVG